MSKKDRNMEPVHIKDALQQFLKQSGGTKRVDAQQVILEWEAALGSLARSATPTRIADGVLTLKPRNSVWRTELLMRRTEIATKINEYFKTELVKTVVVK